MIVASALAPVRSAVMPRRHAFTLVELVVVIMILGILAGVAAPKLLNTSQQATENGLKQTLTVIRNAIELYAAQNGGSVPLNPQADLTDYLRGDFPVSPVGAGNGLVQSFMGGALVPGSGTADWLYHGRTGEFIANSAELDSQGVPYGEY